MKPVASTIPPRDLWLARVLAAVLVLGATLPKPALRAADGAPASGEALTQDAKMKWFREAKFGLFIHWGLYCIPAGEWKGQPIPGIGEWIMNRARIPVR